MFRIFQTRPAQAALANKNRLLASILDLYPSLQHLRGFSSLDPEQIGQDDDELIELKRKLQEKLDSLKEKREKLKEKKGRAWTDSWTLDDMMDSKQTFDDLPDWAPEHVSKVSMERVKIYAKGESKIPTLHDLAVLPLPPPPPPMPSASAKVYALRRKRHIYKHIYTRVKQMAEPRIHGIQQLTDWQDKQDAVDVLFEDIEKKLREAEVILGRQPQFGKWVEQALEEYLRSLQPKKEKPEPIEEETEKTQFLKGLQQTIVDQSPEETTSSETKFVSREADENAVPIFMDCYSPPPLDEKPKKEKEKEKDEPISPNILIPLAPSKNPHKDLNGRMVEEWELAAHKKTKRIMLRQCMRSIAQVAKDDKPFRVFVHGRRGIGKTAALAAIVASARSTGSIVLYISDGNLLHISGFYNVPNKRREGIFDLPVITAEICKNMLDTHQMDLELFQADTTTMKEFFTDEELDGFKGFVMGGGISLPELLKFGAENNYYAPMCFAAAVDVLLKQDQRHFVMVFDEFNCLHDTGHYFNEAYDPMVKKFIPYNQISLFKPFMDAMAIDASTVDEEKEKFVPVLPKRGGIIVATTESAAVARKYTDPLISNAKKDNDVLTVEVPRLSHLEVEHILANFECIGIGKLRFDQGETVMNPQEVAYLRCVAACEPLALFNACIIGD
jgi:small subunit ribosomal protein S29